MATILSIGGWASSYSIDEIELLDCLDASSLLDQPYGAEENDNNICLTAKSFAATQSTSVSQRERVHDGSNRRRTGRKGRLFGMLSRNEMDDERTNSRDDP